MLTPSQASAQILERIVPIERAEETAIASSVGRVLASPIVSDIDLPPFDKSAMDGFAVHSSDFGGEPRERTLRVVGESRAGAPFAGPVPRGACVEIFTGAELPADCD